MKGDQTDPQTIADRVHSAAIHVLRAVRARDKASGLTPAQLSGLSVLYFLGPLTLSRLAEAEQVTLPSVSRLVKDMERGGLVARTRSEQDGRSSTIEITAKGRALFERARVNRLMALTAAFENLTGENLETLAHAAALMESAAKAVREG